MILNFVQPILFCIPKSTKYPWTSRRLSTTCSINTIFHLIFLKATQEIILFSDRCIVILHVKLPFCLYGKTINIISLTIFDRYIDKKVPFPISMYYNLQHITLDLKLLKMRLKLFHTKRVRILKMALKSNRIICLSSLSYNFVENIHHIHYLFYLEVNL